MPETTKQFRRLDYMRKMYSLTEIWLQGTSSRKADYKNCQKQDPNNGKRPSKETVEDVLKSDIQRCLDLNKVPSNYLSEVKTLLLYLEGKGNLQNLKGEIKFREIREHLESALRSYDDLSREDKATFDERMNNDSDFLTNIHKTFLLKRGTHQEQPLSSRNKTTSSPTDVNQDQSREPNVTKAIIPSSAPQTIPNPVFIDFAQDSLGCSDFLPNLQTSSDVSRTLECSALAHDSTDLKSDLYESSRPSVTCFQGTVSTQSSQKRLLDDSSPKQFSKRLKLNCENSSPFIGFEDDDVSDISNGSISERMSSPSTSNARAETCEQTVSEYSYSSNEDSLSSEDLNSVDLSPLKECDPVVCNNSNSSYPPSFNEHSFSSSSSSFPPASSSPLASVQCSDGTGLKPSSLPTVYCKEEETDVSSPEESEYQRMAQWLLQGDNWTILENRAAK